jgi:hypothetical protein
VVLSDDEEGEDMLDEARELILNERKASASYLQRRLRIGYARAARILDLLEQQGIVGPADGAKPREILLKPGERDEAQEFIDAREHGNTKTQKNLNTETQKHREVEDEEDEFGDEEIADEGINQESGIRNQEELDEDGGIDDFGEEEEDQEITRPQRLAASDGGREKAINQEINKVEEQEEIEEEEESENGNWAEDEGEEGKEEIKENKEGEDKYNF